MKIFLSITLIIILSLSCKQPERTLINLCSNELKILNNQYDRSIHLEKMEFQHFKKKLKNEFDYLDCHSKFDLIIKGTRINCAFVNRNCRMQDRYYKDINIFIDKKGQIIHKRKIVSIEYLSEIFKLFRKTKYEYVFNVRWSSNTQNVELVFETITFAYLQMIEDRFNSCSIIDSKEISDINKKHFFSFVFYQNIL